MPRAESYLRALARHRLLEGHLALSATATHDRDLYRWAALQRESWRSGELAGTIERKLRELGFPFEVEDCEWEHGFARIAYYRRQWARRPPPRSRSDTWLSQQRYLWKNGELREDRRSAFWQRAPSIDR